MIIRCFLMNLVLVVMLFSINLKSFSTYTFDVNKQYNMQEAKAVYFKNKCHRCHGDEGQKKPMGSRILKHMSAPDIKAALIAYTLDGGSSLRASKMALYARALSHDDMDNIIAYIKGENFALELGSSPHP